MTETTVPVGWVEVDDAGSSQGRPLRAVRAGGRSAAEAVAWAFPQHSDTAPVGFAYSAQSALWFRVQDGQLLGRDGPVDLAMVYELRVFDGDRELRWLQQSGGRGPAVVVAENGVELPEGEDVTPEAAPIAMTSPMQVLAGDPVRDVDGWTKLASSRYRAAYLPVFELLEGRSALVLRSVEYATEDRHGNLTVVDSRLVALSAVPRDRLKPKDPRASRERTDG